MTTTYAPLATAVFPRRWQITAALVVGFTLLTAITAQFRINLDFTPVPITGQTFAVLMAGGVLGSRAGAASQALYWMGGLLIPWYAGGNGGVDNGWEGWDV
ncbi:MAG: biotin transporter BioY, partial [Akkermansiaceae bacterium]|nr:biotin transporter BioY [Akkermansiaceae bacterium]